MVSRGVSFYLRYTLVVKLRKCGDGVKIVFHPPYGMEWLPTQLIKIQPLNDERSSRSPENPTRRLPRLSEVSISRNQTWVLLTLIQSKGSMVQ